MKAAPVPATPSRPIWEQASQINAQREQRSADSERAWQEQAAGHYMDILVRFLDRSTTPADADVLASLMVDLAITPEQFRADMDLVEKARLLANWHDNREQLDQQARAAADEYRAMQQRHKEEERRLYLARNNAENEANQAHQASFNLELLKRRRPLLFAEAAPGQPPRLREPVAAAQG